MVAKKDEFKEVDYPEIPPKEELKTVLDPRLGQRDILPTQVVQRLLSGTAVVAHALSGASHTGTMSDSQHGARGTIASAHAWADILKTTSSIADITTRSINDLTGTLTSSQLPAKLKRRFSVFIKAAADTLAATATAEITVFQAQDAVTLTAVFYLPAAALTADNSNYATLFCYRRNSTGGAQTTAASVTTQITGSGNWTAFDGVSLGTLSVSAVAAGEMVTFEITKTGTGVIIPAGVFQVEYTVD